MKFSPTTSQSYVALWCLAAAIFSSAISLPAQVRYEDILKGPGDEWLTYAGDYASQRHSPLDQINRHNVKSLVPKWVYHFRGAKRLEPSPIVHDGIMYVTNTNEVHALDARTGRKLWGYFADDADRQRANRGVAILGDRIYLITSDAHLVALHRVTGALLWDREFASSKEGYHSSVAPLALKNEILVGVGGGGSGQRGFVAALSADTGEELWRFWTVPAEGEPGSETWGGFPSKWGGAPTWTVGSFDPELNLIYWPTGNPWPDFYGGDRPGDNLYSDSLIAVDLDTERGEEREQIARRLVCPPLLKSHLEPQLALVVDDRLDGTDTGAAVGFLLSVRDTDPADHQKESSKQRSDPYLWKPLPTRHRFASLIAPPQYRALSLRTRSKPSPTEDSVTRPVSGTGRANTSLCR